MSRFSCVSVLIIICVIVFQLSMNECRPLHKKIVIDGHEWTVPNEPGWEEILQVVEPMRHQLLANCATSRECRLAAEKLRKIFLQYPVSSKYYDDSTQTDNAKHNPNLIFKWG